MYQRLFKLPKSATSAFILGPRQTGKTTYLTDKLRDSKVLSFDFLETEVALRYETRPELFRQEIESFVRETKQAIIFIDEIQKVPKVLDGVQWILNRYKNVQFLLTGSSARKLKREGANMLGGRAEELNFHPLTYLELGHDFNLNKILASGSLPSIVNLHGKDLEAALKSYSVTYLKQEILDESIVRNITPFSNFLDIAAEKSGELINYSEIAKVIGLTGKTIQAYYQILEDTLICYRVTPYLKSSIKRLSKQPRFYFFDIGVSNFLANRRIDDSFPKTKVYGYLFEQFIFLEWKRLSDYANETLKFFHWRIREKLEVDLIIESRNELIACEIKSSEFVDEDELNGLKEFGKLHKNARKICLCRTPNKYLIGDIEVLPWRYFFNERYSELLN